MIGAFRVLYVPEQTKASFHPSAIAPGQAIFILRGTFGPALSGWAT
jgi:hypothetical protein